MQELVINLHMHTTYSDGSASHAEIGHAALHAGLDAVIVTDHNVLVSGPEGYYQDGSRKALLLIGEEIHDPTRMPQKNHMLVIGAGRELATYAGNPQQLIDAVRQSGGYSFIAHPVDPAAPAFNEANISWVDWNVTGFTGIELWNGFSEFKSRLTSKLQGIYYALNPKRIAQGPFPETLRKWDELLAAGHHIAAVGGSDAHALRARLGPIHRTVFPYEFHFRAINTHLYIPAQLTGSVPEDRQMILDALSKGRSFIGYDLAASTRGFRFTAHGVNQTAWMGEEVSLEMGVTFQIRLPQPVECQLVKDGRVVKVWSKRETCTYSTTEPGAYRVEAYIEYLGKRRGWIFSNPIYVIDKPKYSRPLTRYPI